MSLDSLNLDSSWRDYYGNWSSLVEPQFTPLEESKCHAPRVVLIPSVDQQVFPLGGKLTFNFHLVPGSIIWGMCPCATIFRTLPGFTFQLTDVQIGHAFFQEPCDSHMMTVEPNQSAQDQFPSALLLPSPWPVVGDGLFTLEAWGTPGARFYMLLFVAEVTDCPVR
jgi:hypothetical protein